MEGTLENLLQHVDEVESERIRQVELISHNEHLTLSLALKLPFSIHMFLFVCFFSFSLLNWMIYIPRRFCMIKLLNCNMFHK